MLKLQIDDLNRRLKDLQSELNKTSGQIDLLDQQINSLQIKVTQMEARKLYSIEAVEVLHAIQRDTRDSIKAAFENTVTFALRSIYNDDYRFQLEFTQRGNLGELYFKLKSPKTTGYLNVEGCTAGGSFDIISLALRFVLLQVIQPKIEGFVLLDEPTKMVSREYRTNEFNFYKAMSEKLNRQIIIVTHAYELIEQADYKIKIGATVEE